MTDRSPLLRVALPVPLLEPFDYLWRGDGEPPARGSRVRVPFGASQRIGIVLERIEKSPIAAERLKPVIAALDAEPAIGEELLGALQWAAQYYHHPLGEALSHALPAALRRGAPIREPPERHWRLSAEGARQETAKLARRAGRQARALEILAELRGAPEGRLKDLGIAAPTLARLAAKRWVEPFEPPPARSGPRQAPEPSLPELTPDQRAAIDAARSQGPGFHALLLHGVTGSGKTEVFLRLIDEQLSRRKQTLLLVPEIGLTPQLVRRLRDRFGDRLSVIHSGLTETELFRAWREAHSGEAMLIVGTRSAVFAPLPNAGLVIVDEEHDISYKQQHGLRYSARDLAVVRARRLQVPVLLASATPSLESYQNALSGRYRLLSMPRRIGAAGQPRIRLLDLGRHPSVNGLSTPLLASIEQHLAARGQVLLFINRRGFAPALFCPRCHTAEQCARCDARLTIHAGSGLLRCHHCGQEKVLRWACPDCGAERIAVGAGTQRITDQLRSFYPTARIARLDRDATSRKGALDEVLSDVEQGKVQILVGTQMLTKGHDFPGVTLVGVLNADQGLFGTDFRSEERLAQTILQVAGRSGRRAMPGEVLIQTHYPEAPLLQSLLEQDYAAFARLALRERRDAGWPPFSHLAVWRAEAARRETAFDFLRSIASMAAEAAGPVQVFGPAPAPMERRGGRYRAHLLFHSAERGALHALLTRILAVVRKERGARRARWAVDVDPVEL